MTQREVLVVGAGIIGLTTALRLAAAGFEVSIVSADDPLDTTSVLATAMVGPTFGLAGPRVSAWEAATVEVFRSTEAEAPGVRNGRGRFIAEGEGFIPPGADKLAGFAICSNSERAPGHRTGFWGEVPLVHMDDYVPHLVEQATAEGISIERIRLASLAETQQMAPRVVNCAGVGTRHLVHNYGHGGLGVSLSWGCAEEVVGLLTR